MKKTIEKIKRYILGLLGIRKLIENQYRIIDNLNRINKALDSISGKENDILKAAIFNNTIEDSIWLKYKSFSPGVWAVDYSFLYTLYRVLDDVQPKSIIEFGFGQSSKLIHQYAHFYQAVNAVTCEHDKEWVRFFKNSIRGNYDITIQHIELEEILYKGEKTLSIKDINLIVKDTKFDLIVVDAPFRSDRYSRSQILQLAENNLADGFCIIVDDYERAGEQETVKELVSIITEKGIQYASKVYSGVKKHFLICDEKLKFLVSL